MSRFQIVVGETSVQKAVSYLVIGRGLSPEAAINSFVLLTYTHDKDGESYYTLFEEAEGPDIFTLKKKYRALFGSGIQIIQLD